MKDLVINATNLTKKFGTTTPLIVQLLDNGTPVPNKPFSITINGVKYNRTSNTEGKGTLNINLQPGIYPTTIKFDGDSTYNKNTRVISVSVVTYDVPNYSKSPDHYFEVNKIPFKVLMKDGFDSETGVTITRTRLLHNNKFNNVPMHNFNQGNAGVNFEVSLMIRPEYLYEGKPYSEYLEMWEKYQKVVNVVTDAFDIPNGKYTISIKSRKQVNKFYSSWKVEFYQYYVTELTFGGADEKIGTVYSSVDKTLINSSTTIDSKSNPDYIKALQTKLIEQGYFTAGTKADGKWSNELTQDIVNYQKSRELQQTGVGDSDTISKITADGKWTVPNIDPSKIIFGGVIGL